MSTAPELNDFALLERFTDQPSRLPARIRELLPSILHEGGLTKSNAPAAPEYAAQPTATNAREPLAATRAKGDECNIEAYALVDLDSQLCLAETWVILTETVLVVWPCRRESASGRQNADSSDHHTSRATSDRRELDGIRVIPRRALRASSVVAGLSCNTLRIQLGGPSVVGQQAEFLLLRFTQRQRHAVDSLVALLEREKAGANPVDADTLYAQNVAQPIREAQALVTNNEAAVVWRLLSYLRPYRTQVTLGMGAALLITMLSLVPPLITGYLIDDIVAPVQTGGGNATEAVATAAWLGVAALAASYALRRLAAWVRLRFMAVVGEYVARDLRTEIYAHMQKLSVAYFSKKKTGSLITRVTADTDRLWEFLALGVVDVSLSIVMLVGLSAVLLSLDWRLGLIVVIPLPLVAWGVYKNGQRMQHLFVRAWRKWSRVTDVVSDTIPGFRVVKAFDQHGREQQRFDRRNTEVVAEFTSIHHVWTSFWPLLMAGVDLTVLGVWTFALPRLLEDSTALGPPLSLGTFVSFLLFLTMLVAPIEIIGQLARVMNRATTSAHRVFEVLDTEPSVVEAKHALIKPVHGKVTFENVTFAYDGIRQTLKGISFNVNANETIGLVGPSGGGKTTITNLIARFYDVTGGRILIDGVDVRDLDPGHYRRQVGMVLQDPYLFHGSVLENLRYGAPEAALSEVVAAAKAANAHDFICKLPHGYDTLVGERGHTLSGGERQRVSIARAVLADPKILILDEATSAVDTETEQQIQQAMDRLSAGRTVFAIAHRLSTLRRADRIFTIKDGRLIEQGTHEELLAQPHGVYRKLSELQQRVHEAR